VLEEQEATASSFKTSRRGTFDDYSLSPMIVNEQCHHHLENDETLELYDSLFSLFIRDYVIRLSTYPMDTTVELEND